MRKLFGQSIKTNTILIFGTLTLLLVFIMARLSYVSVKNIYLKQLHKQVNLKSSLAAAEIDLRFLDFIDPQSESAAMRLYRKQLKQTVNRLLLSDVFIFDSTGTILVNTGQKDARAGLLLNLADIKKLPKEGAFNSLPFKTADGQWYLWNYRRLNEKYFLGLRESSVRLAEIDVLANWFIGIGFIGIVLVLIAGWFVGRRIAGPVNKLVAFSAEMGKGNLQAAPPLGVRGELAVLQKALIRMRDDLAGNQQEKERMLAQIAHELRNPLGGISLLAGLIKEDAQPESKTIEYAQRISDETEGLKNQISAYLNFSKPLKADIKPIEVQKLFDTLQKEYAPKMPQGVRLRFKANTKTIRFDPLHLRQILTNLIDNAIRAVGENGLISISAENGRLSVSDDGSGIAPENLANVFEPFYTTSADGAGLGLAICRKLCRENGADISVENNFLEGCTFTIKLS